jgi:ribosomal protein L29
MEKLDSKSLRGDIYSVKKDMFDLRIKKASGNLTDTSQMRKKRRLIASLYTKINANFRQKKISKQQEG